MAHWAPSAPVAWACAASPRAAPAGTGRAGTGPAGAGRAGTGPAGTWPTGTAPAGTAPAGIVPAGAGRAWSAFVPRTGPPPGGRYSSWVTGAPSCGRDPRYTSGGYPLGG